MRAADDGDVRRLPVVVLTTSRSPVDVARAYERGASAYVAKPFDVDDLLRVTRSIVEFWFGSATLPG
jgi:CheY-like chemotaxis protein